MLKANNKAFKRDLLLISISVFIAVIIWRSSIVDLMIGQLDHGRLLSAFIAGFFFTSAFTTAPALIFLIKIAQLNSIFLVSVLGASGAVIGDAIIFYFVRERLLKDFMQSLKKKKRERIRRFIKSKIIRFSLAIAGGILIALPLFPDETALAILGASKITTRAFIIITFSFNFAAIYLLSLLAKNFQ